MRENVPASNALLVGISGIDASGKGFVTEKLRQELEHRKLQAASINADGWLNLPDVRFSVDDQARNFYDNGIRLDAMFDQLVLPLRASRSIEITADLVEETATAYKSHVYRFTDIDVILLEGIFLFKRDHIASFDLKVWIECGFETALARAIARNQEGLSEQETVRAYRDIYFPAQRLHFAIDRPQRFADLIFPNY